MRSRIVLSTSALLVVACARVSSLPGAESVERHGDEQGAHGHVATQDGELHILLARGCIGLKECDALFMQARRRVFECARLTSSECAHEREDERAAASVRDEGFQRALHDDSLRQVVASEEGFRRLLSFGCSTEDDCYALHVQAYAQARQCAELPLDCTRQREDEATAAALRDAERACRATPRCLAKRIAKDICEANDVKRYDLVALDREQRTPAAAVDALNLYELVRGVKEDDDAIADLRARYESVAHHPFDDVLCEAGDLR